MDNYFALNFLCVFNFAMTGSSYITHSAITLLSVPSVQSSLPACVTYSIIPLLGERNVIFQISNSCDLSPPTLSFTSMEALANITSSPKQRRCPACREPENRQGGTLGSTWNPRPPGESDFLT